MTRTRNMMIVIDIRCLLTVAYMSCKASMVLSVIKVFSRILLTGKHLLVYRYMLRGAAMSTEWNLIATKVERLQSLKTRRTTSQSHMMITRLVSTCTSSIGVHVSSQATQWKKDNWSPILATLDGLHFPIYTSMSTFVDQNSRKDGRRFQSCSTMGKMDMCLRGRRSQRSGLKCSFQRK